MPLESESRSPTQAAALEESATFNRGTISYVHQAAERGLYDIRGLGAKRRVPSFDDLVFLTASASRYPLEGYRESCVTETILGARPPSGRFGWRFRSRSRG